MSDASHDSWRETIWLCLLLLLIYFVVPATYDRLNNGPSENAEPEEAYSFVQEQGYDIEKTVSTTALCSHRKSGDTTGVEFSLLKDGVQSHAVVCAVIEFVYEWPKDDPLHLGNRKHVDTKRYLTLRVIP